jgi:hypothetical protein
MKRTLSAGILTLAVGLALVTAPSASAKVAAPTQSLIYATPGCGNRIDIRALGYNGKSLGVRTLVRSTGNTELIPYDVSSEPNVFLYASFNCDSKTFNLYTQSIGIHPVASLIASLNADTALVGATWDMARRVPVVLIRDSKFNYSLQMLNGGTWSQLWSAPGASFGSIYLHGVSSRSGREFIIWGDDLGNSWKAYRLSESGYLGEYLSGPGKISTVARSVLDRMNAFIGPSGSWVCDSSAYGKIADAITQSKCASVQGGFASSGAFTYASPNADQYWLYLNQAPEMFAPPVKIMVTCLGSSLFSCGTPQVDAPISAGFGGEHLIYRDLYDVKKFLKLGSTQVP